MKTFLFLIIIGIKLGDPLITFGSKSCSDMKQLKLKSWFNVDDVMNDYVSAPALLPSVGPKLTAVIVYEN